MSEQRTDEWLAWRRKGIGSSDAAVIMNASPWQTRFGLWLDKTGRAKEPEVNYAMQRGINLEPEARAHYELLCDVDMPPVLAELKEWPIARASLDGWNKDSRRFLEIKCPGKDSHAKALAGEIPENYKWQMCHQAMVTDALGADYFSYKDKKGVIVKFTRDKDAEAILLAEEKKFWALVESDTPPEFSAADLKKKSPDILSVYEAVITGRVAFNCAVDSLKKHYEAQA